MPMRIFPPLLLMLMAGCATLAVPTGTSEELWSGEARAGQQRTRLLIRLRETAGESEAELTLAEVGVSGWPASAVRRSGRQLVLDFPSDSGTQTMVLTPRGTSLEGRWTEAGHSEPARVSLRRLGDSAGPREERLTFTGPAGGIGASLILPPVNGPFPGVVMVHGSGAQPRDANRFAAEALARRGIAVIIFDKRGVGESGGELAGASFEDLAADAVAVARVLAAREDVTGVGFFGHSQGGWIAPLAAVRWGEAAFVITSAGPAVPPSREAHWDVVRSLRASGAGDDAERAARTAIDLWHAGLRTSDWSPFDLALAELRTQSWFESSGIEAFAERPDPAFARAYRAQMDHDPLPVLRALQVPMLSILAPEDESMDAIETERILAGLIAEGRDIRVRLYPGYDHTMRRRGPDGVPLRWPAQPNDYYDGQADFIRDETGSLRRGTLPLVCPTAPSPAACRLQPYEAGRRR